MPVLVAALVMPVGARLVDILKPLPFAPAQVTLGQLAPLATTPVKPAGQTLIGLSRAVFYSYDKLTWLQGAILAPPVVSMPPGASTFDGPRPRVQSGAWISGFFPGLNPIPPGVQLFDSPRPRISSGAWTNAFFPGLNLNPIPPGQQFLDRRPPSYRIVPQDAPNLLATTLRPPVIPLPPGQQIYALVPQRDSTLHLRSFLSPSPINLGIPIPPPPSNLPGPLLVSAGYNIADATALVIKITRPDGSILTVSGTVGSKDAYTWNGLYEAGTYAVYQPVAGDINLLGSYQVDLTYKGPTLHPVLLHNNFFVTDLSTFATSPSSSPYGLVAVQNVVWF